MGSEGSHMHGDHGSHEEGRDPEKRYVENLKILEQVNAEGGITEYARTRVNEKSFYGTEDLSLFCSDERTDGSGPRDLGGPLFALFILKVDRQKLAEVYRAQGIVKLTSHHECGAAKAAYIHAGLGSDPSWEAVNAFAQAETKRFAEEFGFDYEHIGAEHMATDGHFHPGVCIYVDDVGGFSWRQTEGMPMGYKVSSAIAKDPVAGVVALLDLVAFGGDNAGVRMKAAGIKFPIYIVSASITEYDARVAQIRAAIAEKPYRDVIEFGMIEKPEGVEVREKASDKLPK
jgi:hypothetical protein